MKKHYYNPGKYTSSILSLIGAGLILLCSQAAIAQPNCIQMKGEASLQLVAIPVPGATFALGGITYYLDDQPRFANAMVKIIDMQPPTEDGTIHITAQMFHDFMNGDTLTWQGKSILSLESPGEFRLNERLHLIAGTGSFEGIDAIATGHGHISMNDFTASISAKGWLCPSS